MQVSRIRTVAPGSACLLAPWLVAAAAHAQAPSEDAPTSQTGMPAQQQPAAPLEAALPSAFSVQLNLDFTNAYFYHGVLQQDQGLIIQPAAELTMNVHEHDDFQIDALLATWNSFGPNGGTQTSDLIKDWYESDLIFGVVLTKGEFSLAITYAFYTSPSDAYPTVQELDLKFEYDDSDLLGEFALHPHLLLAFETGAHGSDFAGSDPGAYLELGVTPGFSCSIGRTPVSVSFPLSLGLSLYDYYQNAAGDNDTFGFFQVGVKASVPLPFGDRHGTWTVKGALYGLFLGDNTAEFNHGDHAEFIATIGLQVNF
jgi:hypothetical protein